MSPAGCEFSNSGEESRAGRTGRHPGFKLHALPRSSVPGLVSGNLESGTHLDPAGRRSPRLRPVDEAHDVMIDDLDKSLENLLQQELPPELVSQVTISFAPPDGKFPPPSVKLPAIDLFLYDVRENRGLRDAEWRLERRSDGAATIKGSEDPNSQKLLPRRSQNIQVLSAVRLVEARSPRQARLTKRRSLPTRPLHLLKICEGGDGCHSRREKCQ